MAQPLGGAKTREMNLALLPITVTNMSNDRDHRNESDEFAKLAEGPQVGLLREFWDFLRYNKKWWLLPILITLVVLGAFVLLSGTAFAPFIYTLF